MTYVIPVFGLFVMLGIAWLLSVDRKAINWRTVVVGTAIQFVFALLILKTPWGQAFFLWTSDVVTAFLNYADEGSRFIFGDGFEEH